MEQTIKVIAAATKKVGRKTEGIYEVRIKGVQQHKFLPMNELKEKSGVKKYNQFKKVDEWLNTPEGTKWAIDTEHVTNF